jgi:hypothetical protein
MSFLGQNEQKLLLTGILSDNVYKRYQDNVHYILSHPIPYRNQWADTN